MHALVIAVFAVSTALAQAPQGSTPPPPPPSTPAAAPAPAPAAEAPAATAAERNAANIAAEGDGRWALIGVSTSLGLGYYGWAIPSAFNMPLGAQAVGTYMLTGAAGFFVPFALTFSTPVTWGQVNLFYAGGTHGPGHAALVLGLIPNLTLSSQAVFLSGILGGALEMGGGLAWSLLTGMTAGTAHSIIITSDVGAGVGFALSVLAGWPTSITTSQLPAGLALVGAIGGAYGGSVVGDMLHLTWGDAELLWISTLIGAYVPVPFIFWASTAPDPRAFAGLMLLGAAGGATAAWYLLQGIHLELGQAILIDLGSLAGGLVGLGTSLILGGINDFRIILTATMVGIAGGYGISYVAMKAQGAKKQRMAANVQVTFNPMALSDVLPLPKAPSALATRPSSPQPLPALAVVGSF